MIPEPPIIFLDFDGVIRVAVEGGWVSADTFNFCHGRMKVLAGICKDTGARVVVSSDWRNLGNRQEIAGHLFPHLSGHLHEDWATPICGHRWNEVARWLRDHPGVTSYAILDDFAPHFDGCPQGMFSRLVLCNNRYGFVPELVPRLMSALG